MDICDLAPDYIRAIAPYQPGKPISELKRALSRRHGVPQERIVLGNGSNDVLEMTARAFLAPGLEAIYSQHAFAVYPLAVQAVGGSGVEVPARDFAHDLDAMLEAVTPRTRLVFLANPNNPTGTLIRGPELLAFLRALPPNVMVVLDEAYNEYLPEDLKADSIAWLAQFPNLIITRTFSKAYGLAGLRVGYAFA